MILSGKVDDIAIQWQFLRNRVRSLRVPINQPSRVEHVVDRPMSDPGEAFYQIRQSLRLLEPHAVAKMEMQVRCTCRACLT